LKFHHTGCLVENISNTIQEYRKLLGENLEISDIYNIEDQKVSVCFLKLNEGVFLELIEPKEDNIRLKKMLKRGETFYHIAFMVNEIDNVIADLVNNNYKVVSYFKSEAFGNKKCAFLYSSDTHLIEIIEE